MLSWAPGAKLGTRLGFLLANRPTGACHNSKSRSARCLSRHINFLWIAQSPKVKFIGGAGPTCACMISMMARQPLFCVVLSDRDHWRVEAEWPDGSIEQIDAFKSHFEAVNWISRNGASASQFQERRRKCAPQTMCCEDSLPGGRRVLQFLPFNFAEPSSHRLPCGHQINPPLDADELLAGSLVCVH